MSNIIKTLATAQFKMAAIQKQMAESEFKGSAGGGLVTVTITGAHVPRGVTVHPDVLKEDAETVQDLLSAAMTAAHLEVEAALKAKSAGLAQHFGSLGIRSPF